MKKSPEEVLKMTESTTKVQFAGRAVLLVHDARTSAGHQIYEVDGQRCWANGVVGLMDLHGDPVPGSGTRVVFTQVEEVPAK
ncbi:hypothetical protein [Pseudomonas syringae]|uniref:hypothetical protein n=1 Tax=Pseudomonas syringae TaxID=317 RepID=UPI0006CB44D1|nr:hypothetical protein [Pseudomonas syringae]ALD99831.1 hypothetical protein PSYRMG_01185 [Pseudomonas syringae UMAF0158]MCK9732201.1 hypothetical protein [Pseudomonas syringae pv. syringae]